jgi:hypothetical protein
LLHYKQENNWTLAVALPLCHSFINVPIPTNYLVKFFCFVLICALQVLERDDVMKKFHDVIDQLEQALHDFPYNKLDISDEVREQVTLLAHLKNYFCCY